MNEPVIEIAENVMIVTRAQLCPIRMRNAKDRVHEQDDTEEDHDRDQHGLCDLGVLCTPSTVTSISVSVLRQFQHDRASRSALTNAQQDQHHAGDGRRRTLHVGVGLGP